MFRRLRLGLSLLMLGGCASSQVNYNTLEIASTYDSLITKQIAFNILKTNNYPFSIPSYVRVTSQSIQTTDSLNPTFTAPFSPTNTLTQTAGVLTGRTSAIAGAGLSFQAQANWQQNYSVTPVDDPDQLRRLRSIFQFVTGLMDNYDFESDYPLIATSGTAPSSPSTVVSGSFDGKKFNIKLGAEKNSTPKKKFVRRYCKLRPLDGICREYAFADVDPDLTFIRLPGCVLCDLGVPLGRLDPKASKEDKNKIILQKNPNLIGRMCKEDDALFCELDPNRQYLLYYRPGEPLKGDAIALPSSNGETLQLKGIGGQQAFYELALFAQEAASQGTGSPTSGGQSDGRKSEPLQRLSVPVSGGGTTGF